MVIMMMTMMIYFHNYDVSNHKDGETSESPQSTSHPSWRKGDFSTHFCEMCTTAWVHHVTSNMLFDWTHRSVCRCGERKKFNILNFIAFLGDCSWRVSGDAEVASVFRQSLNDKRGGNTVAVSPTCGKNARVYFGLYCVHFEQIIVKRIQFGQNWEFFPFSKICLWRVTNVEESRYTESQNFEVWQAHPHTIFQRTVPRWQWPFRAISHLLLMHAVIAFFERAHLHHVAWGKVYTQVITLRRAGLDKNRRIDKLPAKKNLFEGRFFYFR